MRELFGKYNINVGERQEKLFEKYYEMLVLYNSRFNLTAITGKEDVFIKHFIDSLLCVDKLKSGKLADIGSGGGFPALPVKIMRDDIDVTLIEATGKKCEFLREVISELNLRGAKVINARAEEAAKSELRESFDMCTARAVARLNTLSEYCLPFVKVGGEFVAFKGNAAEEVKEAENAFKILGGKLERTEKYSLDGAERTVVFVKKIRSTDKKYPRGKGKERKNPL